MLMDQDEFATTTPTPRIYGVCRHTPEYFSWSLLAARADEPVSELVSQKAGPQMHSGQGLLAFQCYYFVLDVQEWFL